MPTAPSVRTWFITGASSGLGEALARYVLERGDAVAATFRKPEQALAFEASGPPARSLGVLADVTDHAAIGAGVKAAIVKFGSLDVVVNNAGYGALGTLEEIDDAEARRQFDANVFVALAVLRAALPQLRRQGSGHVVNVTSIGGLRAVGAAGVYCASKFALEGIGEALAQEVGPLGIHVTNVEPGPFRTKWAGASATKVRTEIDDYRRALADNFAYFDAADGNQVGDPARAARAMYELTRLPDPPLHLPLGAAAYDRARAKFTGLLAEIDAYESLGRPTDFEDAPR